MVKKNRRTVLRKEVLLIILVTPPVYVDNPSGMEARTPPLQLALHLVLGKLRSSGDSAGLLGGENE